MKKFVTAVCVLASFGAFAQEIGTEIQPGQPTTSQPSGQTNYDNPYGQPAQTTTTPTTTPAQPAAAAPATVPGPDKGRFGIRASFGGGALPSAPASGAGGVPAGTFGLRFLATDTVAIDFDLGLGLGVGSTLSFGLGAGFGITAYLGSSDRPIRPLITGGLGLSLPVSRSIGSGLGLAITVGGGAEYWFNDHFSLDGKLLVGVPISLSNTNVIPIGTFQPGVGANFYF